MFFRSGFLSKKVSALASVGGAVWGAITGTLSAQTDLQSALDAKAAVSHNHAASEITSGSLALARGGTGSSLADPNADRILFWDDSAGVITWLTAGTNLTITGTTLDAAGSSITEYRFTADPDTGFDNPAANTIDVVTGGSVRFKIITGSSEIRGPNAATSSSDGVTVTLRGGPGGSSSGGGGDVEMVGGSSTSGFGGDALVTGGQATGNNNGGYLYLTSGADGFSNDGTGSSGNISIETAPTNAGHTGDTFIATGTPGGGATNKNSGQVLITTGARTGSGVRGNINFAANGGANVFFRLNTTGRHAVHVGSTPSITSGGGSGPSIEGRDEAFLVTIGTGGVATSVTITFAIAFTNAPIASAQSDTDIVALKVVTTTTTIVITATAPFTAGSKLHVINRGYE